MEEPRPPEAVRESDSDGSAVPECDGDGECRSAAPAPAVHSSSSPS